MRISWYNICMTTLTKNPKILVRADLKRPRKRAIKFSFIDLFAGIGGTRIGFENAGGECTFSSEWDKHCQITYYKNFNEAPHGDIREIKGNDIEDFDILVGGFPCQPFSIAGVSKKLSLGRKHGFEDKEQGNLFFEIVRILHHKKPKAFMLENVKNLRNHDNGNTFRVILSNLKKKYHVFDTVIDAKHYVPQHRERTFIVGFRRDIFRDIQYKFPDPPEKVIKIADILEPKVDSKYTLSDGLWNYLQKYAAKHKRIGNGFGFGLVDPSRDSITRTLSARYYKDGSEILIRQEGRNPRRLTPRECARLMGFPVWFQIPVSDSQAYHQFGNSVVVPVVEAVAISMVRVMENYGQNK